ncbi:MAG: hypothetical protein FD180_1021 [Planctomycetota bacterium]|nr:MAG: hypothetical protein FD180_1021 [Planctomycetota bacterium]
MRFILPALAFVVLTGCSSGPTVVTPASEAQKKELWEPIAQLAGEWTSPDENGKPATVLVVKVSSNNSIVHASMMPGTPHEMTNVYHLDGPSVVMTHYCAAGNQPRMRATEAKDGTFVFRTDGVTNLRSADETYMGSMTLKIADADHFEEDWSSYKSGKEEPHVQIQYTRKK